MKKLSMLLTAILACAAVTATAQDEQKAPEGYKFTDMKTVQTVPITNQYRSGTCWCFSTISFPRGGDSACRRPAGQALGDVGRT